MRLFDKFTQVFNYKTLDLLSTNKGSLAIARDDIEATFQYINKWHIKEVTAQIT